MKAKETLPVIIVMGLLLLYYLLVFSNTAISLAYAIFVASPFLLSWMGYTVIRHGKHTGKELEENEEWGYADKNKDELNMF